MIAEDKFGAAFRVREWWPIFRANIGGYIITYVLLLGITLLLTYGMQLLYFSIVLCCTIPIFISLVSVYLGAVTGALFGQAYRVGKRNVVMGLIPDEAATDGAEHAS
jgi:hypothetical protein